MKMLTVSLLVCALMVLSRAAAVPDAEAPKETGLEGNSLSVNRSRTCSSGWTPYNGRCFDYFPGPNTWADAEEMCQGWGGNLASVHSFHEQEVIQKMIVGIVNRYEPAWIGGYDATQEDTWFWSDGTPFWSRYWDVDQPDNHQCSNCLMMNAGDNHRFDDQPCNKELPYVCAIKL